MASRTEDTAMAGGQDHGIYKDRSSQSPHSPQPSLWPSSLVKLTQEAEANEGNQRKSRREPWPQDIGRNSTGGIPLDSAMEQGHTPAQFTWRTQVSCALLRGVTFVLAQCRNVQNASQGSVSACD